MAKASVVRKGFLTPNPKARLLTALRKALVKSFQLLPTRLRSNL
jgi:hypothetical protein